MELVIIGNGPSRNLYKESSLYDHVIACNFADVVCDDRVFVDAFAARHMRPREKYHDWLDRNETCWFGERCFNYLKTVSAYPGGTQTLADYFLALGHEPFIYPSPFRENQRFFNSGHAAFHIGCSGYEPHNVHLFGFDSLFTGDHYASYTNIDLRGAGETTLEINTEDTSEDAIAWHRNWEKLFEMYDQPQGIYFYGYSETSVFDFTDPRIQICKIR